MLNDDAGLTSADMLQMGTGLTGMMGACWGEGRWKFASILLANSVKLIL